MTTLASSLLDFILDLLRDPAAAEEFQADPEQALASAGLDDVCAADVHAVMPMLADFAPVGAVAGIAHAAPSGGHVAASHHPSAPDHQPEHGEDDHRPPAEAAPAIEHLKYIQSNYHYTSTTTIDASHSVWAGEDVYQVFGEDVVIATGGSVVAGDDIGKAYVDNSTDNSIDVEDSFNTDDSYNNEDSNNVDVDVENSGNTVEGDGNAVGEGNRVDNTDNSDHSDHSLDVDIDDSLNGNALGGGDAVSGNGNVVGDDNVVGNEVGDVVVGEGNTVGNEVDVELTDNSTNDSNNDNSTNDSNNDNSVDLEHTEIDTDIDTEIDTEIDDVVIGDGSAGGDLDQSLEVEDSGNGNFSDFSEQELTVEVPESEAASA